VPGESRPSCELVSELALAVFRIRARATDQASHLLAGDDADTDARDATSGAGRLRTRRAAWVFHAVASSSAVRQPCGFGGAGRARRAAARREAAGSISDADLVYRPSSSPDPPFEAGSGRCRVLEQARVALVMRGEVVQRRQVVLNPPRPCSVHPATVHVRERGDHLATL